MSNEQNYSKEPLGNNILSYTSKAHSFGTDAFLLADFANPKRKEVVCDMGTGCGIIPLLWQREHHPKETYALEIQKQGIDQLKCAVDGNNLVGKIIPLECDISNLSELPKRDYFDLVTMNPPYQKVESGQVNCKKELTIARHELCCTLDDVCSAAYHLLHFGGRVALCYPPDRLAEVLTAMSMKKLEPKKIRFIKKRADLLPWLFMIEGRKGGKAGMQMLPPLIIENDDGSQSDELICILGSYKNN